ncbi:hypothetical protein [Mesorhizobium sp. DCY119]|uniref:hypothetical protein n=1 Tax=Mesorhizobium sp. DCY119 TaxID=2108445 RepID=UPI0013C4A726|nr:hypothetical protein [Mesorhizobium sp. DCY119]
MPLTGLASAETFELERTFGLNVPLIGYRPQHFAEMVSDMTDGESRLGVDIARYVQKPT